MSQFDATAFAVPFFLTPAAGDATAQTLAFPFDTELVSVSFTPTNPGTTTANTVNVKINGVAAFSANLSAPAASTAVVSGKPDAVTAIPAGTKVVPTFGTVGTSVGACAVTLWLRKK